MFKKYKEIWNKFKDFIFLFVGLFKKLLVRIIGAEYKAIEIIQIIIFTVTFIMFLNALQLFIKKPSLNIDVKLSEMPSSPSIYSEDIYNYYMTNGFKVPELLNKILISRMPRDKWVDDNTIFNSHKSILQCIKEGNPEYHIELDRWGIKNVEDLLTESQSCNRGAIFMGRVDFFSPGYLLEAAKQLKLRNELTKIDYYIFLTALLNSRLFENYITIKNDGDFDLQNLEITFIAPYSEITEDRKGNIKTLQREKRQLFFYIIEDDNLNLRLPVLKKGGVAAFTLLTKEFQLEKDQIITQYTPIETIDTTGNIKLFLFCLSVLSFLYLIFKLIFRK